MPVQNASAGWRGLFVIVILSGSFLLFLIQPMVARLALPLLGGAPGVWNSAMLVFQVLLLAGYAYAHALARLPLKKQAAIHVGLLLLGALTLPPTLADIPPPLPGWEVLWVPALFLATIGPVFFLLSAQSSLMQHWYAASPRAKNPYRLYAASNIGSFAGLLSYPLWMEPEMALGEQSRAWAAGYLVLILLVGLAAASRWNVAGGAPQPKQVQETAEPAERVGTRRLLLWLALAAVPSGLTLSTTTLLTTDLVAMPLLWVIPLGVYLLSFSVAFSDSGDWARILSRYAPVPLLLVGSLAMISGGQANPVIALAMVALLFVLSVALHARLYALRPPSDRLTLFYLAVAAGGALGGTFPALVAPVVFDWVYEHPILLLAAALLMPQFPLLPFLGRFWQTGRWPGIAAGLIVLAAAILAWYVALAVEHGNGSQILLGVCALAVLGLVVVGKRWAFAAVFALLMIGHGGFSTLETSAAGVRSRSYFGIYSVEDTDNGAKRQLTHGTTMHGWQWLLTERRRQPTAYYGGSSGAGLALVQAEPDATIGVAGLGVGTLACYRKPGQDWTFFEIDPQVARYSRNGTFTFLSDCAPDAAVVIGDARLELADTRTDRFDILLIDAFTSDAIPLHLLTREAFETYGRGLSEDGLLLVHISNRFIDLAPMIAGLAEAGGWHGLMRLDANPLEEGLTASHWIALSPSKHRLDRLQGASPLEWNELPPPSSRIWTDDNASLIPLLRL
ncbi:spermidine synthase [Altericroceibacterium xinjiangense]|uniref:spermidine synthase n=1 Tax=Altericroceibacterium xinjiangense TaxID=762261 RepID=UPI000F7EDB5F|nr:fused MFS/spermidine synthase [Altericroceibacterium xinjiangense]